MLPLQLEEDPHRFVFASIEEDARYDTYDRDFLWLVNAGVAHMVRQATEAKSPLRRTEVAGRFKLYQSDTGMLLSRYPQATARAVYLDRRDQNLGGTTRTRSRRGCLPPTSRSGTLPRRAWARWTSSWRARMGASCP